MTYQAFHQQVTQYMSHHPPWMGSFRLIYIILMTGVLLERANSIIPGAVAAFRPQFEGDFWADLSQVFSAKITDPWDI